MFPQFASQRSRRRVLTWVLYAILPTVQMIPSRPARPLDCAPNPYAIRADSQFSRACALCYNRPVVPRIPMTYRSRMCASVAVASAAHALAVMVPWDHGLPNRDRISPPVSEPVVMQLQPPPQPPKRLVDITAPTQDPIDALTDLIAEANSKAADATEIDSGENAPRMEEIDESERLAAPEPPKPIERPPTPPTQPAPESPASEETIERAQLAQLIAERDRLEQELLKAQQPVVEQKPVEQLREDNVPELPVGQSQGRKKGGVVTPGFLNFEAQQHEFAPYLKVLRNRVERHWRQAILLRFSGTTRRKAVLDCAIAPDGRIVKCTIVESGGSGTYAEMCRQAVLDAGPFPPFPFDVPPGYRSQNIEIRWTFSYL